MEESTISTNVTIDFPPKSEEVAKTPRPRRTIRGLSESKNPRPQAPRAPRPAAASSANAEGHSLRGPELRNTEPKKAPQE